MESRELRIGNKILLGSTVVDVIEIWDNGLRVTNSCTGCGYTYDQFSPIILTEKWFEKFGFEEVAHFVGHDEFIYMYKLGDFVYVNAEQIGVGVDDDKRILIDTKIEYVHQLQNLYFCLVGDELSVNK